jgi:transposase
MGRPASEPLRPLTAEEHQTLSSLARATSERADVRQRAVALLGIASGLTREAAARQAGYVSGYSVSKLIRRFKVRGVAALAIAPGRGRKVTYAALARQQILDTLQQPPDRVADQTATWSLTTLQRHLRAHGLPHVSRDTGHQVVRQAGYSWQRTRTWCPTGTARRKRKTGTVTVHDPQAENKNAD